MATWEEFAVVAPRIASIFTRRQAATGNLCMLGTIRPDGFPRISPMEPSLFEGQLWIVGMPGTAKFRDLFRDPRYTLHTATADPEVKAGDAKLWGRVENVKDEALQRRWAEALLEETGFDVRDEEFDHFFKAGVIGAAAVEVSDGHLDITVWKEGRDEKVVRKH